MSDQTNELRVYRDGIDGDMVIAESAADATVVWCESVGERLEDYESQMQWVEADPAKPITIQDEYDGQSRTAIPAEWIKLQGRGFLCTPNA